MSILVTGGTGLVGKAIQDISTQYPYKFVFVGSNNYDLTLPDQTKQMFLDHRPDYVIHLAAYVGGLYKNMNQPVRMIEQNIKINMNVVEACHQFGVKKLIACLSTCIFPDQTSYPIDENMLHQGPPHHSNSSYAYAKRMLDLQCEAYRKQYNSPFYCIIPTNIYGPHDQFSLEDGHVIPSLIHKCHLAQQAGIPFEVRGSGKPLRQFIYSLDLAKIIVDLLEKDLPPRIIVSGQEEVSIKQVAELIAKSFEYDTITFNDSYSDGQFKKTANGALLSEMMPITWTSLEQGIKETVDWFKSASAIRK